MGFFAAKKYKVVSDVLVNAEVENDTTDKKLLKQTHWWYVIALVYLFFDYVRPQAFFPAIGLIRPSLVTIIILLGFALTRGKRYLFESTQIRLVWMFVGLLALFVFFGYNRGYAYKTALAMFLYIPFIVALMACINSFSRWRHFLWVLTVIMTYMAVYMLTHKGMGPGNYFLDENDVSLFIDMLLPFAYFLFLEQKKLLPRLFLLGSLLLSVGSVVISFSRGGFVGLVAVFVVIWLFSPRKILTIAVLAILGGGVFLFSDPAYWKEMKTIDDPHENTAQQRFWFWQAGINMWKENPFGVGGGNFPLLHVKYQPKEWNGRNNWGRPAHSIWFTLLPETGVIGVLIFFILLGVNIKDFVWMYTQFRKSKDPSDRFIYYQSIAFAASFAGFFAAGTFISVLYYAHYWYLNGLIIAAVGLAKKRDAQRNLLVSPPDTAT